VPEIVVMRLQETDDRSHVHVDLVGYQTDHIATEPIMVTTDRAISLMLYERFWMKTLSGEETDLISGKCSVCGHEPYLRTAADGEHEEHLLDLPEA
jgi:hypothetical protein